VREAEHREGRNAYIYDADSIDSREVFALFVNVMPIRSQLPTGGRGEMRVTRHADQDYVIRHYRRGGKLASVNQDCYLWNGLGLSRPWREWRLLAELHERGLPVPKPLAAKLTRRGVIYRADLATARLPAEGSLAELLLRAPLAESVWQAIGRVIWDFHAYGVCHADLNAHNVMLADSGARIWLLDFDKARHRSLAHGWQRANLERLKRSLDKVRRENPHMNFTPHEWHCLFSAYSKASNAK
jgi:3-deoxy-D-manno-octulosonic acid kinase